MATTLSIWTPEQIGGVIGQVVALVVAVTALFKATSAKSKADTADAKGDIANDRSSNNAKAITGVQQQLTQVALQTPAPPTSPVEPAKFSPPGGSAQ